MSPLSFCSICNGEPFIFRDSVAQSPSGMLITNAHYKSTPLNIGHERDRCTTWLRHCDTLPLHCHDQCRSYNYVNGLTRAHCSHQRHYVLQFNRKVAKLYQQTTCTAFRNRVAARALQRNVELMPRPLSGSRSARDQGTSPSVKVSHYRGD